jgi:hypothetical protein
MESDFNRRSESAPTTGASFPLQLVREVCDLSRTLGVLLHGSYARGSSDKGSDIDLICVNETDGSKSFVRSISGYRIDLYAASCSRIDKAIHADLHTNNNNILYAFVRGRALIDRDGSVARLIDKASKVWTRGPAAPGGDELQKIKLASIYAVDAADRFRMRATRSLAWREMVNLRSATLFVDCLHTYCRAHRLWASAIWELLDWSDSKYDYLRSVIRPYFAQPTLETRLEAIQRIAQTTLARIRSELTKIVPEPGR